MKLTKQHFIDGLDLEKVEMKDLKEFAKEHGLDVESIFKRGRQKRKCANMLADWVEQQQDVADTTYEEVPMQPAETEPVPEKTIVTGDVAYKQPTATPPGAFKRDTEREEIPCRNTAGGEDMGSNWHNRRALRVRLQRGSEAELAEMNNEESAKTSYIARRLRRR